MLVAVLVSVQCISMGVSAFVEKHDKMTFLIKGFLDNSHHLHDSTLTRPMQQQLPYIHYCIYSLCAC